MNRRIIAAPLMAGLVSVLAGCSSSVDTSSKSYKDGYHTGYNAAKVAATYPNGAQACQADLAVLVPGGDDSGQYTAGCTDGYNDAMNHKPSKASG